jgi:hypothetical protein
MRRRVDRAGIHVTVGHSNADDPSNAEGVSNVADASNRDEVPKTDDPSDAEDPSDADDVSNPVVRRIGSRRTRSDVAGTQYTH